MKLDSDRQYQELKMVAVKLQLAAIDHLSKGGDASNLEMAIIALTETLMKHNQLGGIT